MNLTITDYFDIGAIVLQIIGFLFLLPIIGNLRWKYFGAGKPTKKEIVASWISNYGGRIGIILVLIGFGLQLCSIVIRVNHT